MPCSNTNQYPNSLSLHVLGVIENKVKSKDQRSSNPLKKVVIIVLQVFGLLAAIFADFLYIPLFYVCEKFLINKDLDNSPSLSHKPAEKIHLPTIDFRKIDKTFNSFITECEEDILPLYEKHEKGFDKTNKVHSRMHASRSLIIGEMIARFYHSHNLQIDFTFARRLTALHDAGRKANGPDRWEKDSANILSDYLSSKGDPLAKKRSRYIVKKETETGRTLPIEYIIFQSGDSFDIMRPCCHNGGINGYNFAYLTFLNTKKCPLAQSNAINEKERIALLNAFKQELWIFITDTEKMKNKPEFCTNKGFINNLLAVIHGNPQRYPILNTYFPNQSK